jgi:hypothetical protein
MARNKKTRVDIEYELCTGLAKVLNKLNELGIDSINQGNLKVMRLYADKLTLALKDIEQPSDSDILLLAIEYYETKKQELDL